MAKLKVSDHALLRYIERTYDINLEIVRKQIGSFITKRYPKTDFKHKTTLRIGEHKYMIEDNTVKTICVKGK